MNETERPRRAWLVAHLVLLAAATVVLVLANRGQWFFGDEWEFLVNRGLVGARYGAFYPHNEHWSTLPILVYTALRNTVGLASYWPYIGVLLAIHLALTHLLWRVMLRAGVLPAVATAAAAVFSVLGAGSENLLWAFQIGFVGAVAFGWAAALVVATPERRPGRRDLWAVALLLGALMSSGVGVPMVAVAAVTVWITGRALLRLLVVGGVPAVVFVGWYVTVGRTPDTSGAPSHSLGSVASIVLDGLDHVTTAVAGVPKVIATVLLLGGGVLCAWSAVRVVRGEAASRRLALPLAGVVGIVVFAVMVAFGRGDLGSSRYVYVLVALGLPVVAVGLTTLSRWRWVQVAVVLVVIAVGAQNVQQLWARAQYERARESWTRDVIESAARMITQGDHLVGAQPEPVYDPDITVKALRLFVVRNKLPTNATSDRGELGARLWLQVAVINPGTASTSTPATVTKREGVEPVSGTTSCLALAAGATTGAVVATTDGHLRSLWLRSQDGNSAGYEVQVGSGLSAPPVRVVAVPAGKEKELLTSLPAGQLTIRPTTPGSVVCTSP